MKRVVWTVLATAVSALAARVAVRALAGMWRKTTHENPPKESKAAKFVVGKSINAAI